MVTPVSRAKVRHFRDELNDAAVRREWFVSRAIWVLMTLVVVAALLGLSGSGPLGRADSTASLAGGAVALDYPRFARFRAPSALVVKVDAPDATGTTLRIALSSEFAGQVDVREIAPQPDATSLGPGGAVREWQVEDWAEPIAVTFAFRPDDHGRIDGKVTVAAGDGAPAVIDFTTWVLP